MSVRLAVGLTHALLLGAPLATAAVVLGAADASVAQSFVAPRSSLLSTEIASHTSWKTSDGRTSMESSAGQNEDVALFLSFSSHLNSSWDRHHARVRPTIGGESLTGDDIWIERRGGGCIEVRRQEPGITPSALVLCPQIEPNHPWMEPFLGQWSTQSGTLRLYRDRGVLRGEISRTDHNGVRQILHRLAFNSLTASEMVGAWAPVHSEQGDRISLQLSPDGASFTGRIWRNGTQPDSWSGRKLPNADDPSDEPTSPLSPAADAPQRPQGPAPQPANPARPSRDEVDALVAKLKGAWRTPFGRLVFTEYEEMGFTNLEAQLTDPNTRRRHSLYLTSSGLLSLVTYPEGRVDNLMVSVSADGRSFDARGSAEGPGGVWRAHREGPPPSAPAPSNPAPPAPAPAQPAPPASAEFKPLNRVDVRVDRVVVARGYPTHQVHAFVTVRNTSAVPQYFTSGFLKAVLADADGVSWERSQPYRASGEPAELFGSTPVIQPGGELRARFIFMPEDGAQLTSLTLSEGDKRAEFPVGGL